MRALFSPETLRAGAVKVLKLKHLWMVGPNKPTLTSGRPRKWIVRGLCATNHNNLSQRSPGLFEVFTSIHLGLGSDVRCFWSVTTTSLLPQTGTTGKESNTRRVSVSTCARRRPPDQLSWCGVVFLNTLTPFSSSVGVVLWSPTQLPFLILCWCSIVVFNTAPILHPLLV